MKSIVALALATWVLITTSPMGLAQDAQPVETKIDAPGVSLIVRMQGPCDAEVPLQIVCYLQRTESSDQKLRGAPVELDERLGGVIAALRARGEFKGDKLETLLLKPPSGTIRAQKLLLLGLGPEADLSLETMEAVGRTAAREAAKLGAQQVAFAPMIKDAGNDTLAAGEVETAVVRGMLFAYDTDQRLQSQGFASSYAMRTWIVEAGPTYYDETITGVKKAVTEVADLIEKRNAKPYASKSK